MPMIEPIIYLGSEQETEQEITTKPMTVTFQQTTAYKTGICNELGYTLLT